VAAALRRMQRMGRLAEPFRRVIHGYYMATRTVRLDEESKRAPAGVRRATGTSVSGALKRGLVAARDALRDESSVTPFDVYRGIDLGPGGYARAPARQAKRAVRALLRRKRPR